MSNLPVSIAGVDIGRDHPPFVIAEISANHNGKIETALKLITEAKQAGASAVKLQTYTADTITLRSSGPDFQITGGLWHGRTLHELYQQAHMPWEWHKALFDHARELGIPIFSTPFDHTAVDLLEELGTPAFKIASFEATDLPLISYVASTGKPLIISTGMADDVEIGEAVEAAIKAGCQQLVLLHCVSGYPAPPGDYNLTTIPDLRRRFGCEVGLSDHTLTNATAIASVALGACVIEKHFTLDRSGGGPDDSFSLEPPDLKALCYDAAAAWAALGTVSYSRKSSELGNVQFRRSLYFVRDLPSGAMITKDDVRSVRPGFGLPPKMLNQVVGKRTARAVRYAEPVQYETLTD